MEDNTRYLKLTDRDHYGEIVKQVGRQFFGFINGAWKRRGLGIGYYYPDAPEFGCYEVIPENEALKLLKM